MIFLIFYYRDKGLSLIETNKRLIKFVFNNKGITWFISSRRILPRDALFYYPITSEYD